MGSALSFNGTTAYLDLGTMGSFGSSLTAGFYCKFYIKTTSTSAGNFINFNSGQEIYIGLNRKSDGSTSSGCIRFHLTDNAGHVLQGGCDTSTGFNDGNINTIEIIWVTGTNSYTLKVNGTSKTVTYTNTDTPSTFSNFSRKVIFGARDASGTIDGFFNCTLDNIQIGTTSSSLYGVYLLNEGTGTTTADTSGQGNTGTLSGSTLPSWVTGLVTDSINLQVNIGDTWKTVTGMQINIGDTWKTVTAAQINIGDAWKTIY